MFAAIRKSFIRFSIVCEIHLKNSLQSSLDELETSDSTNPVSVSDESGFSGWRSMLGLCFNGWFYSCTNFTRFPQNNQTHHVEMHDPNYFVEKLIFWRITAFLENFEGIVVMKNLSKCEPKPKLYPCKTSRSNLSHPMNSISYVYIFITLTSTTSFRKMFTLSE